MRQRVFGSRDGVGTSLGQKPRAEFGGACDGGAISQLHRNSALDAPSIATRTSPRVPHALQSPSMIPTCWQSWKTHASRNLKIALFSPVAITSNAVGVGLLSVVAYERDREPRSARSHRVRLRETPEDRLPEGRHEEALHGSASDLPQPEAQRRIGPEEPRRLDDDPVVIDERVIEKWKVLLRGVLQDHVPSLRLGESGSPWRRRAP